ncbi:hypothetical protein Tco_0880205, partial [Tanacetum coccineum]
MCKIVMTNTTTHDDKNESCKKELEFKSVLSNCNESTAKGMFSWSGLHLDSCAGYMMARNTAETV